MSSVVSCQDKKANNISEEDLVFHEMEDSSSEIDNKSLMNSRYCREMIEKLEYAVGTKCETSPDNICGRLWDLNLLCYGYSRKGLDIRYQIERLAVNLLGTIDAMDYEPFSYLNCAGHCYLRMLEAMEKSLGLGGVVDKTRFGQFRERVYVVSFHVNGSVNGTLKASKNLELEPILAVLEMTANNFGQWNITQSDFVTLDMLPPQKLDQGTIPNFAPKAKTLLEKFEKYFGLEYIEGISFLSRLRAVEEKRCLEVETMSKLEETWEKEIGEQEPPAELLELSDQLDHCRHVTPLCHRNILTRLAELEHQRK